MLNEFCQNTDYNKKYIIRSLSPQHEYRPQVINRKIHYTYTNKDIFWLKKIWEILVKNNLILLKNLLFLFLNMFMFPVWNHYHVLKYYLDIVDSYY